MLPSPRATATCSPKRVTFKGGSRLLPCYPATEHGPDPRHRDVSRRKVEDDEPRWRWDHASGRDPAEQKERPDDVREHRPIAGGDEERDHGPHQRPERVREEGEDEVLRLEQVHRRAQALRV